MKNQPNSEADDGDEILYHLTDGIAGAIGEEFFRSLARHLADALQVRYSFVTECTDESRTRVRALAFWDGTGFAEDIEYTLRGTCLLYTSPSPRDRQKSRMPSSA